MTKLYHELLLEAAACHLVADWKGVVFVENDKEIEPECTPENATKLFNMGDIGVAIWAFVSSKLTRFKLKQTAIEMKCWESPRTLPIPQPVCWTQ